ncbi:TM1266 family iron-only hydrogenase system putative regulator [Blautia sp.]|jgi:putative iron-only hydrogenase system regulator|nr:TM1266 family iron-only hydrogenase system putative regulator [uncultured Blautia sp.]
METRVAVVSIIVEDTDAVEPLNELLHSYRKYIIGRLGIPHREKGINIICVVLDAPMNQINALSGALGRLDGISTKVAYSKV